MKKPVQVFISSAIEDTVYKDKLLTHLAPLQEQQLIEAWDDEQLVAGTVWSKKIKNEIENAQVILLMISPDALSSEYIRHQEIEQALKRQVLGKAVVIPIIVRPCFWKVEKFAHLQALPTNVEPISKWKDEDAAYLDIVEGIVKAITTYTSQNDSVSNTSPSSFGLHSPIATFFNHNIFLNVNWSEWRNYVITSLITIFCLWIAHGIVHPDKHGYAKINIDNCSHCESIPKDEEQIPNVNFRFKCDSLGITFGFPVDEDIEILLAWYNKLCSERIKGTKFKIKYRLKQNINIIQAVEP